MKPEGNHNGQIEGMIKDGIVCVLIFLAFYSIDFEVAAFISVICAAILLIRRIILNYNPGFVNGHHIVTREKELVVPKAVDVFDLGKVSGVEHLRRYTEIIRTILVPPSVLIIRFSNLLRIEENDLFVLDEITARLQKSDIAVVFSDVEKKVWLQLKESGIEQQLGDGNICCDIDEAIGRASKLLYRHKKDTSSLSNNDHNR